MGKSIDDYVKVSQFTLRRSPYTDRPMDGLIEKETGFDVSLNQKTDEGIEVKTTERLLSCE